MIKKLIAAIFVISLLVLFVGCEQEPEPVETEEAETGDNFRLLISDAPADIGDFEYLIVHLSKIRIFGGEGGENGFEELEIDASVDLTELVGELSTEVLSTELEPGTYTKLELYVDSVDAKTTDDEIADVMVPSEKLQITKSFDVIEGEITTFVFDINVVKKGQRNEYNLLPVISKSGVVGEDLDEEEVEEVDPVECNDEVSCEEGYECIDGECEEKEEAEAAGEGTLLMQITDKKPELNITALEITISEITVHAAAYGADPECVPPTTTTTVEDTTTTTEPETTTTTLEETTTTVADTTTTTEPESTTTTLEETTTTTIVSTTTTTTLEICDEETESGAGWFTVVEGPVTFDLIQIQDVKELLGSAELTAGKYTQIRLAIDDAELFIGNESNPIEIPSGRIKLVKNFNIVDGETTTLTLDFDAQKSVHQAGNKYIMKPTIKVIQES